MLVADLLRVFNTDDESYIVISSYSKNTVIAANQKKNISNLHMNSVVSNVRQWSNGLCIEVMDGE